MHTKKNVGANSNMVNIAPSLQPPFLTEYVKKGLKSDPLKTFLNSSRKIKLQGCRLGGRRAPLMLSPDAVLTLRLLYSGTPK